ncbi:MAG: hypothetical protein IKO40_04055 [Kiritimatiellae bacterium]|nr:hypothetical protein [Kiritimatiellia bacterium]
MSVPLCVKVWTMPPGVAATVSPPERAKSSVVSTDGMKLMITMPEPPVI